jgi:uncharacterized cupredoxin-like copper-binding protein
LAAVLAATALVGVGCGKTTKPAALSVEMTEPSAGQFKFTAPDRVSGPLVIIRFRNTGKASHQVVLVGVDPGHSQQEVVDAAAAQDAPIPPWAHLSGGVAEVPPGQSGSATVKLAAGSYYLIDPGTSDDNSTSYVKNGAVRALQVTGGGSNGKLPSAAATITAQEYRFGVPNLKAGSVKIRFENVGAQPHLLAAFPIAAGKTIDDVKAAFASEGPPQGPPPVEFDKGVGAQALDPGRSLVTTVKLQPGHYAFVCFLNDRQGGPPHFTKGMLQDVSVS